MPKLFLRIDFDEARAIGPGKIKLLELIDALGSISAAGRRMKMSYRRAWLLVDSLNKCFQEPLVASQTGGTHGGGASHIDALEGALAKSPVSGGVVSASSSAAKRRKSRSKTADQRPPAGGP